MNINEKGQICEGLNQAPVDYPVLVSDYDDDNLRGIFEENAVKRSILEKQLAGEIKGSNWYNQIKAKLIALGK